MSGDPQAWFDEHAPAIEEAIRAALDEALSVLPADAVGFIATRLANNEGAAAHKPNMSAAADSGLGWTPLKWLRSLALSGPVAAALAPAVTAESSPLDFFRSALTRGQLETLLGAAGLAGLTATVWAAVEGLRATPTAREMQGKFLQDGVGLLSFGTISTFFSGLEGKIGAPAARFGAAMAAEHTQRSDSNVRFKTGNYGMETSSAIEWRFVAEPDQPPEGGWPTEAKLLAAQAAQSAGLARTLSMASMELLQSGARPRTTLSRAELRQRLEEPNARLIAMDQPEVGEEEAIGARAYTGPMYVKYNCVLRGLDSDVDFLRNDMVERCCARDTFEQYMGGAKMGEAAKGGLSFGEVRTRHLNTFSTTLHVINSAIVKLGKLTKACKVYRGVSGRVLPDQFWTPNEFGVRGGVESAFMSTTVDKRVAMAYAAGGTGGFVFEIQQGMIDRGADLGWLSQYPHEKEVLFAPLTGLEVQEVRVEGAILVVAAKLSVNLTSLTIEQVLGKRKKLLADMSSEVLAELRVDVRPGVHPGKQCFYSKVQPIDGNRYDFKRGGGVCEAEYQKLPDTVFKLRQQAVPTDRRDLYATKKDFDGSRITKRDYTGPIPSPITSAVAEARLALAEAALLHGPNALLDEHAHPAEWFNDDANYTAATGVPLMVKRALAQCTEAPMLRLLGCDCATLPDSLPLLEALQAVEGGKDLLERPTDEHLGATRLMAFEVGDESSEAWFDGQARSTRLHGGKIRETEAIALLADPTVVWLGNRITRTTIPQHVGSLLPRLLEIDLRGCESVTALPSLSGLKRLEKLMLGGCNALAALPDLSALKKLKVIQMKSLVITKLPDLTGLTSLEQLNLSGCSALITLPLLSDLPRLKDISLVGCSSLSTLPSPSDLACLEKLNLSGCESLAELPSLTPSLSGLERLEVLNLSDCKMLTELPSLYGLGSLKLLSLWGCELLTSLPSLLGSSNLERLNLQGCRSLRALPDLSAFKRLKVEGMSESLQPWAAGGRKAFSIPPA